MTIKRAREILGPAAESKSDDQVQAIINCFDNLIDVGFEMFEKQNAARGENPVSGKLTLAGSGGK